MDKIDRLFDAVEHPERYSLADIEAMLRDSEVKEVFDLLDKTKSSLRPISIPDVENEWERFKAGHPNPGSTSRVRLRDMLSRKIAASVAICIISLTAVAAIGIGIKSFYNHREEDSAIPMTDTETHTEVSRSDSARNVNEMEMITTDTVIFENEPFESIIAQIAAHYGYSVNYKTEKSKSLRLYYHWNQNLPIEDVVESLNNFGQIGLTIKDKTIYID